MLHRFEVGAPRHGFLKDRPDQQPREQMRRTRPETKPSHLVDVLCLLPCLVPVVRAERFLYDLTEPLTLLDLLWAWHIELFLRFLHHFYFAFCSRAANLTDKALTSLFGQKGEVGLLIRIARMKERWCLIR